MSLLLRLDEIDATRLADVGGKAANLAALARVVDVPEAFCVTTEAWAASGGTELPDGLREALAPRLSGTGTWAVRSSATAEDSPGASFAGLHDSFLHVAAADVPARILACWASLHTERAVAYRRERGVHEARMAVVVQRMVEPRAAGVLFTADPVHGDRTVSAVEAVRGLGEALVSGGVRPDTWRIRGGRVVESALAGEAAALTEEELRELERLGRRIERSFGCPQDIEWCLVGDAFRFVQSRPITTLFPVPTSDQPGRRVFVSVGHQQMMTDPMRPMGSSVFRAIAARPMFEAGGRLFVDPTRELTSPAGPAMLAMMGRSDPLIGDALGAVVERPGFLQAAPPAGPPPQRPTPPALQDELAVVERLMDDAFARVDAAERALAGLEGPPLLDALRADLAALRADITEPVSTAAIMAGLGAASWLDERLGTLLDEPHASTVLSRSAPHNVTTEMGLALLDVADVVRPHDEVVAYLRTAEDATFWEGLAAVAGGGEVAEALGTFLQRFGMRCPGEIDLSRPRWDEQPTALVALLLGHVSTFEPGESGRRRQRGLREAAEAERGLLARLEPDDAEEVAQRIRRLRTFIGYREFPKLAIVSRFRVYRRALLREAARLVRVGALDRVEDLWWLTLEELAEVVRSERSDGDLLLRREQEHAANARLTPPRVLTSDGEVVTASYARTDLPEGALPGLAVSPGVVEGRARVLTDLAGAEVAAGDVLVTRFTDPSWTPLFVTVAGLVTEVGGLMTHGAVIAREIGLPAVVGVVGATSRIRDGQRIRVHGTRGWVELLRE